MASLPGSGPDGGNPLGFLCAVGVLVTAGRADPTLRPRLHWMFRAGWHPIWSFERVIGRDELVCLLDEALRPSQEGLALEPLGPSLGRIAPRTFQAFARAAAEEALAGDRRRADLVAALGIAHGDRVQETQFHMHNLGQLRFFTTIQQLVAGTGAEHLRRALFEPWDYLDDGPTMRWDPVDDRRYAYRADDPSTSSTARIRTERGANRLAIEALSCFPVLPRSRRAAALGFSRFGRLWRFQWPIWTVPITLSTLRSLLSHPRLSRLDDADAPAALHAMGVAEVFRSNRVEPRYRSFSPAVALLGQSTGR